jgi:transposase-like protein
MEREDRAVVRYSEAFQRKVVSEIERGRYSIEGARQVYDIGGKTTIQRWLVKHGTNQSVGKVVRIEMADEQQKLKQTQVEKAELERALGQSQVKIMYLEAVIAEYEKRQKASERKKKK